MTSKTEDLKVLGFGAVGIVYEVEAGLGAKSFAVKTPKKDIRLSTKRMDCEYNLHHCLLESLAFLTHRRNRVFFCHL
jgi:hypothetical protein